MFSHLVKQSYCWDFVWAKRGGSKPFPVNVTGLRAAASKKSPSQEQKERREKDGCRVFFSACILIHVGTGAERRQSVLNLSAHPPPLPSLPTLAHVQLGTPFPASRWLLVAQGKVSTKTSDWSHTCINSNTCGPPQRLSHWELWLDCSRERWGWSIMLFAENIQIIYSENSPKILNKQIWFIFKQHKSCREQ